MVSVDSVSTEIVYGVYMFHRTNIPFRGLAKVRIYSYSHLATFTRLVAAVLEVKVIFNNDQKDSEAHKKCKARQLVYRRTERAETQVAKPQEVSQDFTRRVLKPSSA